MEGCHRSYCLTIWRFMFFAARLVLLMRREADWSHVHSHSCGNAGVIAMLADPLPRVWLSLTLHGRGPQGLRSAAARQVSLCGLCYHNHPKTPFADARKNTEK